MVENQGNAPVEVVVAALDPDRRLTLSVDPQRAVIAPEQGARFGVAVRVDDPFPFGPRRPRPFQVSVAPGRQAPIPLRATLSQGPLLPAWIPPLGNGLALRCAPSDSACRNEAKDTLRTIVTELQNPYSGAGIPSTRSILLPNTLPVVLTAPRDFAWRQLGVGDSGETQTAVIDLGPLLANPTAYVYAVVDTADGQETRRFVIDPSIAKQLFDMLYELPPEMGTVTAATPPPGLTLDQPLNVSAINWNTLWVLASPTP